MSPVVRFSKGLPVLSPHLEREQTEARCKLQKGPHPSSVVSQSGSCSGIPGPAASAPVGTCQKMQILMAYTPDPGNQKLRGWVQQSICRLSSPPGESGGGDAATVTFRRWRLGIRQT